MKVKKINEYCSYLKNQHGFFIFSNQHNDFGGVQEHMILSFSKNYEQALLQAFNEICTRTIYLENVRKEIINLIIADDSDQLICEMQTKEIPIENQIYNYVCYEKESKIYTLEKW